MAIKEPVHPGEVLREDAVTELGLSVGEAGARLEVSRATLSRVLHGHARVSPNLAVRLEAAGVGLRVASHAVRIRFGGARCGLFSHVLAVESSGHLSRETTSRDRTPA
jgi:addiction module HigA family antidote